jgi:hypothetical protein
MSPKGIAMADCSYCHKEIKKDDEFVLVGKYPSAMHRAPALNI